MAIKIRVEITIKIMLFHIKYHLHVLFYSRKRWLSTFDIRQLFAELIQTKYACT